jgi:hypothetical protein
VDGHLRHYAKGQALVVARRDRRGQRKLAYDGASDLDVALRRSTYERPHQSTA